jgi:hypothetical protein
LKTIRFLQQIAVPSRGTPGTEYGLKIDPKPTIALLQIDEKLFFCILKIPGMTFKFEYF